MSKDSLSENTANGNVLIFMSGYMLNITAATYLKKTILKTLDNIQDPRDDVWGNVAVLTVQNNVKDF